MAPKELEINGLEDNLNLIKEEDAQAIANGFYRDVPKDVVVPYDILCAEEDSGLPLIGHGTGRDE